MTIYATLKRGSTYYLGDKRFEYNKPVKVSEAERDLLEDEETGAYDQIEVEGEAELRAKFVFVEAEKAPEVEGPDANGEAKPARAKRQRPAQDA